MKAIGHNLRVRQIFVHDGAVGRSEIDAHQAHLALAFEPLQVCLQRRFAPAQHNVIDRVILQIAERCRIPVLPREKVFVDPQHLRTGCAGTLGRQAPQEMLRMALHRRASDALAFSHANAIDSVPVVLKDPETKRFRGVLSREQTGKSLPKCTPQSRHNQRRPSRISHTRAAAQLTCRTFRLTTPLVPECYPLARWAASGPGIPGPGLWTKHSSGSGQGERFPGEFEAKGLEK